MGKLIEESSTIKPVALIAALVIGSFLLISGLAFTVGKVVVAQLTNRNSQSVPKLGSAREYYEKGVQFKSMGWSELARQCLQRAIVMDRDGPTGAMSRRFLATRIPRYPVPAQAEQKNIEGYNQIGNGNNDAAKATFAALIHDFPQFEWPYGNLSGIYLDEKQPALAQKLCQQALAINPHYVNAMTNLASAKLMQADIAGAETVIKEALRDDPEDQCALLVCRQIEKVKQGGRVTREAR